MQVSFIMMLCWEVIIYQMMWCHITIYFNLILHSENFKMVFVNKSSCRTSLWLLYGLHCHINCKPFSHPSLKIYRLEVCGCPSSGTKYSYCPLLDKPDEKDFSFDNSNKWSCLLVSVFHFLHSIKDSCFLVSRHSLMQMHQPYYYHVLYLAHIHNISALDRDMVFLYWKYLPFFNLLANTGLGNETGKLQNIKKNQHMNFLSVYWP